MATMELTGGNILNAFVHTVKAQLHQYIVSVTKLITTQ